MNLVDLILIVSLGLAVFEGFRRGLILQALELLATVIALWVSFHYYGSLADYLVLSQHVSPLFAKPGAFLGLWIGSHLVISIIAHVAYAIIPKFISQSLPSRLLGIIPAVIRQALALGVTLYLLLALPVPAFITDAIHGSKLAQPLVAQTTVFINWIDGKSGGSLSRTLSFLTTPNDNTKEAEDAAVAIPKIVNDHKLAVQADLEDQMLDLVNGERKKAGLKPLVMDSKLRDVARAHSRDMWLQGYFAHNTPSGKTPFDRMDDAGIHYLAAGENIALAPSLTIAHQGLMHSPPHKANILSNEFGKVGIGIISAGADGYMVTQDFTN